MLDNRIKVGAVNWDCSLPSDTYFGFYSSKALSPKKFRASTPYYATVEGDDKISYQYRNISEYEREMQYALDAGIDYFAYCWYGENPGKRENEWQNHLCKLTYARKMHIQSKLRDKLKLCAIIGVGAKEAELSESDMISLAEQMQEDYYQKIDGRPLVYVFDGYKQDTANILRQCCKKCNTCEPYFVYMSSEIDEIKQTETESAISSYSFPKSAKTYDEFITYLTDDLEKRQKLGMNVIPQFSLGWNPTPRIENPVPWYGYEAKDYLPQICKEEMLYGGKKFTDFLLKNKNDNIAKHILIFAWNEFEEGAYACPTFDKDGKKINTERVQALAKIVNDWKTLL